MKFGPRSCGSGGWVGTWRVHMGGCQKYGPFLDPYDNTAPIV